MFWILAILILFIVYKPQEMIMIFSILAFLGFGYWVFSFISSEPVFTFSISIFGVWIVCLCIGMINKTTEEGNNEDDT